MLNYIILVNKRNNIIVIDYETNIPMYSPDIGYETDCSDWKTVNKSYLKEVKGEIYSEYVFDTNKAFSKPGIYKVEGYYDSINTPDGYFETYNVLNIENISNMYFL